ncbi:MAG: HAMP domain-containing histidine kinase [Sulfurimonas sp.]|uniref:sensor histidine kinase n=1 Tax=Sulfurimonas sp. TaxID=2022749 RepID=UPI00260C2DFE|nr:HAMP domain-containing sensor histidine kinase [Sulfurimonas sp.]MCW8895853.1 HAMP domain-containing histidine kinase [Sulfurimonas sp.]MCW8953919.1 HAMP domain-containing histidine kinase [Sulfurimonas sp.]MCW9068372.1 HAMP domain-containing histidine kinase [Sulfurimonas sp.]
MYKKQNSFYTDFFVSGHDFDKSEVLLKFQYQVLNTVLVVMAVFTFIFAFLSSLGLNPLGEIQTVVNYLLVVSAIVLIIRLRGPKTRYLQTAYFMYGAAFVDFLSALMFVPHDEFRMIWFYLLVFAAYITGGVRAGNIITVVSIITILATNLFYELNLSQTAVVSSILGLIITGLFIRAYTKKIVDFEKEITEHESLMIAQSRFAAMGEMMSMIAHQWRQPLSTTTLMITETRIKFMLAGKEPNEYDKTLDNISDTMMYLSETIDDFQSYFKPQKTSQSIFIGEILERVKNLIETRLSLAKVKLHIKQCENEPIEIYVNELVQVLINILNNAIDILEERNVTKRHIWINVSCDENNVYVTVEDNAGGIETEIMDKVFEPYFSHKSKNGTGLGLYMAKMIIEKHMNGNVGVGNTTKGALFSIVLPKKTVNTPPL